MVSGDRMDIRVEPLGHHPGLISVVAHWHFEEWGHSDPEGSERTWASRLRGRARPEGIPSYYIAFVEDVAVGSVGLCESDMSTHPELSPWLSGLFVVPRFRRRGVGGLLARHAMNTARCASVRTLFLHTVGAERLYESHGWRTISRELYEGEPACVMSTELAA